MNETGAAYSSELEAHWEFCSLQRTLQHFEEKCFETETDIAAQLNVWHKIEQETHKIDLETEAKRSSLHSFEEKTGCYRLLSSQRI